MIHMTHLGQCWSEVFFFHFTKMFVCYCRYVCIFICPIPIEYSMGQIIKSLLSFCQSVCKHSYGRNFDSILRTFCTVIRGPESKIEFVWDKNLITPSPILPQFLKICTTTYGDFKVV